MFDTNWYLRVFAPAVQAAVKAGINPGCSDRLMTWIRDNKERQMKWGEIKWFLVELGTDYEDAVKECKELELA